MVEVRQIDDSELFQLIELNYEYNQYLPSELNKYKSTYVLLDLLRKPGAIALGLFKDKLIGFTLGSKLNKETFLFTSMYIVPESRLYTKMLHKKSEEMIRELGYTSWLAHGNNKHSRIHTKLGASIINIEDREITYFKEI